MSENRFVETLESLEEIPGEIRKEAKITNETVVVKLEGFEEQDIRDYAKMLGTRLENPQVKKLKQAEHHSLNENGEWQNPFEAKIVAGFVEKSSTGVRERSGEEQ